ncbi:hypothetical protein H8959_005032 [Pygathrix nigripes]
MVSMESERPMRRPQQQDRQEHHCWPDEYTESGLGGGRAGGQRQRLSRPQAGATGKDYYQTLGLARGASDEEVKRVYSRQTPRYHPGQEQGARHREVQGDRRGLRRAQIRLREALCGCTVNVPTLDGRTILIVFKDVIRPAILRKVPGEGLCLPKTPEKRGDLIIELEVIFPERIPQISRTVLEQILPT